MPVMYCQVNLFTFNQDVAIVYPNGMVVKLPGVTIDNFAHSISALCDEHNIDHVKLYGLKDFVNQMAENIAVANKDKYENKELIIEVNPE